MGPSQDTESGGFDGNAGETGMRLGLDDDLHVLPECHEKVHQALDGKAFQLVMQECRDLGLVDAERGCNLRLGEPLPLDNQVQGCSQPGLGVEFRRIRQSHIGKNVDARNPVLPTSNAL